MTETVIVDGDDAIEFIFGIHNGNFQRREYGFCCDTGNFRHESETDREDLLYSLLIYRNQPDRIEFEFVEDSGGRVDWEHPAIFRFDVGDAGEPSYREYVITKTGK